MIERRYFTSDDSRGREGDEYAARARGFANAQEMRSFYSADSETRERMMRDLRARKTDLLEADLELFKVNS